MIFTHQINRSNKRRKRFPKPQKIDQDGKRLRNEFADQIGDQPDHGNGGNRDHNLPAVSVKPLCDHKKPYKNEGNRPYHLVIISENAAYRETDGKKENENGVNIINT